MLRESKIENKIEKSKPKRETHGKFMRKGHASVEEGNWEGGLRRRETELRTRSTRFPGNAARHYFN